MIKSPWYFPWWNPMVRSLFIAFVSRAHSLAAVWTDVMPGFLQPTRSAVRWILGPCETHRWFHSHFFLAPCGVGWEYPPVAIGILRFFPPIFLGGQWDYPTTLQWSNMAMDEQTPVDSVEFPRTPPFFEDFRLPWLITSQYSLPIPKAGDISPSRGQEGTVGSPWVSVFPCSLLNGEKKELPTTCALMCHDQMVKIWIFSPWALVWKPNLRSDEQPEVSSVGKIFLILRHYHYDPLCADSPQLCWFASILVFLIDSDPKSVAPQHQSAGRTPSGNVKAAMSLGAYRPCIPMKQMGWWSCGSSTRGPSLSGTGIPGFA